MENAAVDQPSKYPDAGFGTRIAAHFVGLALDQPLEELPRQSPRAASFEYAAAENRPA
jgi:hypothetical protein